MLIQGDGDGNCFEEVSICPGSWESQELSRMSTVSAGPESERRMKKLSLFFVVGLLLPVRASATEPPVPEGRRLREIVAAKFPDGNVQVGGTTGWRKRGRGAGVIVDREFSYVTPENDFKQSVIHPQPGIWNWEWADAWITHCAEQGQVLRLHSPISPQCSRWAKDDSRTSVELMQNFVDYLTKLCQRYDAHEQVQWIDVVNETVLGDGEWHGPKVGTGGWELPWTKIGFDDTHPLRPPLYIKMAFEIANQHAPNTKLIINQHGGMEDAMWKKIKALVAYLRGRNLRVDGIGWQAHIETGWEKRSGNLERLHALIDWAHANRLSFHVTEMNAWLKGRDKDFVAQADTFAAILGALLEHRSSGVVTWNVWNISDADAWQQEKRFEGCLFDRDYRAKPAYYALQRLLENPPPARLK